MPDGYIKGILVPDTETTIPEIEVGVSLSVLESIPPEAPPAAISSGLVSLTNVDISLGHVYGIAVETREHVAWNATSPFDPDGWKGAGQSTLDWDVANDLAHDMVVGGIKAGVTGYGSSRRGIFHDFRACFLNADGVKAKFLGAADVPATAAVNDNVVTITRGAGTWTSGEWIGRLVRFYTVADVLVAERVVWDNDTTTLSINDDGVSGEATDWADVTYVSFPADYWIYDIGPSGDGQEFNGINDFSEFAEVLDLKIKIGASYTDPTEDQNLSGVIAQLQWKNMYDHAGIDAHPHADGANRDTTNAQWKGISHYIVFMFQDDGSGSAPVNPYPVTDGVDTGRWYSVVEVPAPHEPAGTMPSIEATVQCPAGSKIAFWVGAKCATTRSRTEEAPKGSPARLEA